VNEVIRCIADLPEGVGEKKNPTFQNVSEKSGSLVRTSVLAAFMGDFEMLKVLMNNM
jgi:hypothetical protein